MQLRAPGVGVMDVGEWEGAESTGLGLIGVVGTDGGLHGADPQQMPRCSAPAISICRERPSPSSAHPPALKPTPEKSLPGAQEMNKVGRRVVFL